VAPLKELTIPRLELWTDSSIVLTCVQGPPNKWKIFVGNRIALFEEESAAATWSHVTSQFNPADLISREIEPKTLSTSTLGWNGPPWLLQQPSSWHKTEINLPNTTSKLEMLMVQFYKFQMTSHHDSPS